MSKPDPSVLDFTTVVEETAPAPVVRETPTPAEEAEALIGSRHLGAEGSHMLAARRSTPGKPAADPSTQVVLVVDDDLQTAELAARVLAREGRVLQLAVDTGTDRGSHSGRSWPALAGWVLLAGLVAPGAEAAAPPGSWCNAAYAERMNVVVNGRGAAAAAGYSLSVTIDHARMVATGRSLASGNDVRVVWWNGGGWVELDRRLDDEASWNRAPYPSPAPHTQVWFRTQAPLTALETDDNYYIYFSNAAAGAPPSNWANVFRV